MLRRLGKYEIITELGKGAMGVVYRAKNPELDVLAALKTISRDAANDAELMERFRREARVAAKLRHPNIIFVYDYGIDKDEGIPFIAMEYLEGASLEKIISAHKDLPIIKKLDIIIQTCKGLHYAHQHKVVHRDIKPSNIFVQNDGLVKIVDFGIAHITTGTSTLLTRANVIIGTPVYMSPEQWEGSKVDSRSDIFSVGVVLYELLTHRKPFSGEDERSLRFKIQHEEPAPLAEFLRDCPPQLERVVSRALSKNRGERYQTAEDLGFAVLQVSEYFKHDMIEVYLQEGRRSLEEGNLAIAKASFQRALEIDSGHNLAKNYLDRVQEQIDAHRRAQKIEQNLRQAKEDLKSGQFDQAIALLDDVLQLSPEHTLAQEYRRVAIERRKRTQEIGYHLERAQNLAVDADLHAARAELETVLMLDQEHSEALKMMGWVLQELAAQERQRQVQRYVDGARIYLAQKDLGQAMESLENALKLDPVNIEVEVLMRQVRTAQQEERGRQQLEGRLTSIQEALDAKDFTHALALVDQALEEFSDHAQLLKLRAQAIRLADLEKKERYVQEQLQAARAIFQKDQYADAIAIVQRALETVPTDARLTSFLRTVREAQERAAIEAARRQAINDAHQQIRSKDFAAAVDVLQKAQTLAGQSPELLELLQFAREQERQERVQSLLSRARRFQHEENFEEAVRELEQGQRELNASEIDSLLAGMREEWKQFEQRREETLERARKLLEGGEAAKAVALLEAAPKAYLKNKEFERFYAQCREGLDRTTFIRTTLNQFEECMSGRDLEQADRVLQQALRTYPSALGLLGAKQRLRQEQLRVRETLWRRQVDDATVALERMEYQKTIGLITSLPPELGDIPALASQARVLLEEARRGEHRLGVGQQAVRDANERIRNADFPAAINTLEKALAVTGQSPDLLDLLKFAREQERIQSLLSRARQFQHEENFEEAVRELEQGRRELNASQIDNLLTAVWEEWQQFEQHRKETVVRARQMLQAGQADRAVVLLEAAPKAWFQNEEFRRLYAECREAVAHDEFVRATLAQVEKYVAGEDLDQAEAVLQQALRTYPNNALLLVARNRLPEEQRRLQRTRCNRLMGEAKVAMGRMEYGRAIEVLTAVVEEASGVPELAAEAQALLQETLQRQQRGVRQQAIHDANELIRDKDFKTAIATLEKALPVVEQSSELLELLKFARDQQGRELVREVLSRARNFQRDENYEDAIRALERAQGELTSSEIDNLLATLREQWQKFEQQREDTLNQARHLLEVGEVGKAVAALEAAPKAYLKNEEFRRVLAECHARATIVRSTLAWVRRHSRAIGASAGVLMLGLLAPRAERLWTNWRSGYIELAATPWAEVVDIRTAKGERLSNAGGQTPLRLRLPPGEYSIQLKYQGAFERVDVVVRPKSVSPINHIFGQVKVNEMVDELVSKY